MIKRPTEKALKIGSIGAGEKLFSDTSLSSNGLSCNTCHKGGAAYLATFTQSYPHKVAMAYERVGMKKIDADEMVQLCMVAPMAAKPLNWDSKELADLVAYVTSEQKTFKPVSNPCNPCNPCAPKNNPCNPCNPCAPKKNPCNPCSG